MLPVSKIAPCILVILLLLANVQFPCCPLVPSPVTPILPSVKAKPKVVFFELEIVATPVNGSPFSSFACVNILTVVAFPIDNCPVVFSPTAYTFPCVSNT